MLTRHMQAMRRFSSATQYKVGFLGMGNMGVSMAGNLVKNGFEVKGFDLSQQALDAAKEMGVTPVQSIAEASKNVDFIVSSLPRTSDVEKALMDKDGVFANANEGTYIVDSSTISPIGAKEFASQSIKKGMRYIDTPMSGGVLGAKNATLTFMVGTEDDAEFERASIPLSAMGRKIFKCGGPGTGQIAKIVNNMILGIHMCATSEGLALGEKLGIDPKTLTEICSVSTSNSWCMTDQNPRPGVTQQSPSNKNYEGGFQTQLMLKDMALSLEVAEQVNANVEFAEKAAEYYNTITQKGHGTKDFGVVWQYVMNNKNM